MYTAMIDEMANFAEEVLGTAPEYVGNILLPKV